MKFKMENKGLNQCFRNVDIYPKERLSNSCRNWNIDGKCVKMEEVQTIREEEKLVQRGHLKIKATRLITQVDELRDISLVSGKKGRCQF